MMKASVQDVFLFFFNMLQKGIIYSLWNLRNENGRESVYIDELEQFYNFRFQFHDEILPIKSKGFRKQE